MTTLIAFGDSHTAGAEIDHDGIEVILVPYPAKLLITIVGPENHSQAGGSNYWLMKKFMSRVQIGLRRKEKMFMVFGFCGTCKKFPSTVVVEEP